MRVLLCIPWLYHKAERGSSHIFAPSNIDQLYTKAPPDNWQVGTIRGVLATTAFDIVTIDEKQLWPNKLLCYSRMQQNWPETTGRLVSWCCEPLFVQKKDVWYRLYSFSICILFYGSKLAAETPVPLERLIKTEDWVYSAHYISWRLQHNHPLYHRSTLCLKEFLPP